MRQDPSPDLIEESEEDVASQEATNDDIADEDAHPSFQRRAWTRIIKQVLF